MLPAHEPHLREQSGQRFSLSSGEGRAFFRSLQILPRFMGPMLVKNEGFSPGGEGWALSNRIVKSYFFFCSC